MTRLFVCLFVCPRSLTPPLPERRRERIHGPQRVPRLPLLEVGHFRAEVVRRLESRVVDRVRKFRLRVARVLPEALVLLPEALLGDVAVLERPVAVRLAPLEPLAKLGRRARDGPSGRGLGVAELDLQGRFPDLRPAMILSVRAPR